MPSTPSSSSPPTRRRFLRRVGGAVALGVAASTTGCTARVVSAETASSGSLGDPDLDAEAFRAYVEETRARYGDHGAFGLRDPPDDPSFAGAWTGQFAAGDGPERDDDGLVRADYAVARYRLGRRGDGDRLDAWVLWTAARPTTETTHLPPLPGGYRPEATVNVRGLGLHVGFGGSANLVHYDPGGDVAASNTDEYTVVSGIQSGPVVDATVPLETGTVAPVAPPTWDDPPETGFGVDGYTVGWRGRASETVSVTAVCTTAVPPNAHATTVPVGLRYHLAAGGYLF